MRIINIRVDRIKQRSNRRLLNDIDELAKSIGDLGLLNPIHITPEMYLIAGAHRLAAFKLLKREYIPVIVVHVSRDKARLLELDENLMRNELSDYQRGIQMWERKLIYDSYFPDTSKDETFTKRASRLSGESRRTIERYCQIGRELKPYENMIEGTDLENSKMELIKLAAIRDHGTIKEVIQLLRGGRAESVIEARKLIELNRNTTLLGYPVISRKAGELKTVQFNFQLLQAQKSIVEHAIEVAKKDKSIGSATVKGSNANSLTKICAFYLKHTGH